MGSKTLIRRVLHGLGYEVRRLNGRSEGSSPNFWTWLRVTGSIKVIVDIGANNGEFAEFLSTYFDARRTIAIEPLPGCAALIRQRDSVIKNLTVFECAVSDHEGRAILFENGYAPASSLLPVSKISSVEFPQTAGHQKEVAVAVHRLDDLIDLGALENEILIKIDVQGLEDKVIRGGEKTFRSAKFVIIEMSFVPMYDEQPLFEEVHELLVNIGFRFAGIKNQVDSPTTGQPLFVHCLYVNKSRN
jgi:FkbM family methyltransferase